MGLNANVMCRCYQVGRTEPPPFAEYVCYQDGYLELNLPYEEANWDKHRLFEQWLDTACEHPKMEYASEAIANWTGYRAFQQALEKAGWEHFPALKAELPENNSGLTPARAATNMLDELDYFIEHARLGAATVLVDSDNGDELHEHIVVYDGVFIHGADGLDTGVDNQGFFIRRRRDSVEVFRSARFQQRVLDSRWRRLLRRGVAEFVDLDSGRTFRSRNGVGKLSHWSDGRLQDDKGAWRFEYPAQLHVTQRERSASEFEYIIIPLRKVCEAAVKTGNPIRWG